MTPYEAAIKMYHREHDRWRQWALFFFGFIASIFVLSEKHNCIIPFWFACYFASLLSAIWVFVAQSIRATTYSWEMVIMNIENSKTSKAFPTFKEEIKKRNNMLDLRKTLYFTLENHETWKSVTRLLSLLGVISCILFFIIGTRAIIITRTWIDNAYGEIIFLLFLSLFLLSIVILIYKNRKYIQSKVEKNKLENTA